MQPIGAKLVGSNIDAAEHLMRGVMSALRKVKPGDGKAGVIAAIKVERHIVHDDTHANNGAALRPDHRAIKRCGNLRRGRRHHNALAIALGPIEITSEIHRVFAADKADARAHGPAPFLACASRTAGG